MAPAALRVFGGMPSAFAAGSGVVGENLLWLAIIVFSALVVLPTIKLRPARGTSPLHLFLAVFLAICAVRGLRTDPLADDPGARRIAYQDTQFLRRALRYLAPPIEERPAEVDAAMTLASFSTSGPAPRLSPTTMARVVLPSSSTSARA